MTLRGLSVACRLASPLLLLSSRLRFPEKKYSKLVLFFF